MNHCFVVCDLKPAFADRLARYVNKRRLSPYMMESFTDVNLLAEYAKKRYIDVLLIDELLYMEELEKLNIGKVFLLVEDRGRLDTDGFSKLYKYSAIPEIMDIVMCDYANRNKNAMSYAADNAVKIIGAFTPGPNLGHSSFLLTLALKTAERKKAFYLNIKSTYGFRKMLNKMSGFDLSDVMFEIKNGKTKPEDWEADAVMHYGQLDYILPALTITDLHCVETEDWRALLEALHDVGYDYIFLDLDESTQSCHELLRICDLIYSECEDTYVCREAFAEFYETSAKIGLSEVLDKMVRITPPDCDLQAYSEDCFASLKQGKMGIYVDKVLSDSR